MAGLSVEVSRAKANGDKKVAGFEGGIRSLENLNLEVGDTFTMPETFEVYEQKIGDNKAQYIFVDLGNDNVKKFYPSTFTKSRTIYQENGESTGERIHTTGTAADLFRTAGTIADGMNLLKGKKLKVSDIKIVRTLRYGTTSLMNAQIPVIDLVD